MPYSSGSFVQSTLLSPPGLLLALTGEPLPLELEDEDSDPESEPEPDPDSSSEAELSEDLNPYNISAFSNKLQHIYKRFTMH